MHCKYNIKLLWLNQYILGSLGLSKEKDLIFIKITEKISYRNRNLSVHMVWLSKILEINIDSW